MSSFKDLLIELEQDTKKSVWQRRNRFDKKELNAYLEGKSIEYQKFVFVIGGWALNQWIKNEWRSSQRERDYCKKYHTEPKCKNFVEHNINYFSGGRDWEIAVACFGEEEVKKRLEELNK